MFKIFHFAFKIPFFVKYLNIKIKKNTFLLWEPCTDSHGEVIPGYAKYLLDLGYEVSILMNLKRKKEGLFANFSNSCSNLNLFFNNLELDEIIYCLSKNGLRASYGLNALLNQNSKNPPKAKGIIITTARNVSLENSCYDDKLSFFDKKDKVLLVEHDVKEPVDKAFWHDDIITLAPIDYKGQKSIVVNPHYFGVFDLKKAQNDTKNLIIIGALDFKRRNFNRLFDALDEITGAKHPDFKITVIGNGDYSIIPAHLRKFFDIKGRMDFKKMYRQIEGADFILPLLDENVDAHKRYATTGTSGTFQLSYGFVKPCIISEEFAARRFLNSDNAVIYGANNLKDGIKRALDTNDEEYLKLCLNLKNTADKIYEESLSNLEKLICSQT